MTDSGDTQPAQYRLTFDTPEVFEQFKAAFEADIKSMQFEDPQIRFDEQSRTIDLGYSYFEMMAYFEGQNKEVGKLIPFSWQEQVPTDEVLAKQSQNAHFQITRVGGNIIDEYKARHNKAEAVLAQWKDEPMPSSPAINAQDDTDILAASIDKNKPLIIGEWHPAQSQRKFLIEHMDELAKSGAPLVLEHAFKSQQKLIDRWLQSDASTPMPGELKEMVNFFHNAFDNSSRMAGGPGTQEYGFMDLFVAAKKAGVKIIAIEDEISMLGMELGKMHPLKDVEKPDYYERFALMNVNAYEQAAPLMDQQTPFVAVVGAGHAIDHYDGKHNDFIPGLGRMTDGISAVISDDISMYPKMPRELYKEFEALAAKADISDILRKPQEMHGINYRSDWVKQLQSRGYGRQQDEQLSR